MYPSSIFQWHCSCPYTQSPLYDTAATIAPNLLRFCQNWHIPTCKWTCSYWTHEPDFNTSTCLHQNIQQCTQDKSITELLHELHGLLYVQETYLQTIKDLRTAQKMQASGHETEDPFILSSPYPPSPLVRAIAYAVYRWQFLRYTWVFFCRKRGITLWSQVTPSIVRYFLPWLLILVNAIFQFQYHTSQDKQPHPLPYQYAKNLATGRMSRLLKGLYVTMGVTMELHSNLAFPTVLPYSHMPLLPDSIDWYSSPVTFMNRHRYVAAVCLQPYFHNTPYNSLPEITKCLVQNAYPARFILMLHREDTVLIPNLLYNSVSCQLTHPLGDNCTSLWLFQNTRAAAQWPVNFPLYSTTMAEPFSAIHHRMLFLPVHLRMKFDVLPPNAVTPLSASSHVYKSPSATEFFWSVWNQELIVRKHAFQNIKQKNAWDIIKQSVTRCLPVLPYAPMYWIRDLLLEIHPSAISGLFEPGQWLYCSLSPMLRAPYFGQTGAITNPRAVFSRWKEELQQALAWVKLQRTRRGPTYFTYLHRLGFHNFLPLPIKPLAMFEADRMEQDFINSHHPNLNDKKHKQKGFLRWLIRHNMARQLSDTALRDQQLWDQQLHTKRLSITPLDALSILVKAKGSLNGWKYRCLQNRFIPFVNKHLQTKLPLFLHLRIPCITSHQIKCIRSSFKDFLHCTSLPKPVKLYLQSILLIPNSLPRKLLHCFTKDRITVSLHEAQQKVHHSTAPNSVLTGPQICKHLNCPTLKPLLHASLGTCVAPRSDRAHRNLSVQLQQLRDAIPKCRPFPFAAFASNVHQVLRSCLRPSKATLIPQHKISQFTTLSPDSIPIRVDKYPLLFVVASVITFFRLFVHVFQNARNYRCLQTTSSATRTRDILIVYYYLCARMFPFIVRNAGQSRQRNALSVHIPQLKNIVLPRIPIPTPPSQEPLDFMSVKYKLLSAATEIMHLTDQVLYVPPELPYHKQAPRSVYPPSVILSIKGRSLPYTPPAPISSLSTREIFSNGGHPWKYSYSIVSRAASVAQRYFASIFFTLLVCDQQQMEHHFLRPSKEYFQVLGVPVAGFELDLERMFPSLLRSQLNPSYANLFKRARAMYCTKRAETNLYISIAKGNSKQLDCIGRKSAQYYHVLSDNDLVAAVTAESCLNDLFQLGPEIWEQFTGVTIGGKLASQNANILLTEKESNINFDRELPPHTKLCRYVDNIVCLCPADQLMSTVRIVYNLLKRAYGVSLTVEQVGTCLTSLQFQIYCDGPHIHWGLKNKCLLSHLSTRLPLQRYPAPDSMYARRIVRGMLQNLVSLSQNLQTHPQLFLSNLSHTIWEMKKNLYPTSWWLPKVKSVYTRCQVSRLPPWSDFFSTLPWIAVIPPKYCTLSPTPLSTIVSLKTTPTLDTILPLFPDAIPLKVMERTIFPPPSIALLIPLLWIRNILPFCNPALFSTAILLSKSVFQATWPLLQYHHKHVPVPILHFAAFLKCSIPLSHFTALLLFLRRKNHHRYIRSDLAKTLFSWCVGPYPGKTVPRPQPPLGGRWRYAAVQHQHQISHAKKRPLQPARCPRAKKPSTHCSSTQKSLLCSHKRPADTHMLPQSLTAQTALSTLTAIAQDPLPKRSCRR